LACQELRKLRFLLGLCSDWSNGGYNFYQVNYRQWWSFSPPYSSLGAAARFLQYRQQWLQWWLDADRLDVCNQHWFEHGR